MKLSFRHRELTSFDATAVAIEASGLSASGRSSGGGSSSISVVQLDLSHNSLHTFIGGRSLPQLVEFNVSHNLLRSVQNFPLNIVKLDVSHNKLEHLHGIEHLQRLTSLDCSHNIIQDIEADWLPASLQTLALSHNQIRDAIGLCHLHKLLKIFLDHNNIGSVGGVVCLGGLKALRHVTIQGNPVCTNPKLLPALTASIPKLTTLDGLVLSQAQANQIFRVAQAAAEKQRAARHHESQQMAAVRRAAVRQDAEDEAAEAEVRRLEARAKELERLAAVAAADEHRLRRQNKLLQKQLRNVSEVLEAQTEQLQLSRAEVAKQTQFSETLRRTLASLDRTFKQQHASIIAKRLVRTPSATR
jgi:Leucine-rich repeat (LRR) protein